MARPLFGIPAAARLDITAGSSSRAAYYALVAQYQFGTPVIHNRAPTELAATIGVPLYSQVGDPGLVATIPGVVVVSFPFATPTVVVAGVPHAVSTAVPGGTFVGVNYVDANGVLWPDVDWEWQISVEAYQNQATGNAGTFDSQVVTWTGDGTANRLIPTAFPLDVGTVAVWGCGGANGVGTNEINFFRHNNPSMAGTALLSVNNDPITNQGIMSFGANGFTVTVGTFVGGFANTLNVQYAAVVLRDTTVDRRFLRVGSYYRPAGSFLVSCDIGQTSCGLISGSFNPLFSGMTITDGISGNYIFSYVSASVCNITGPYRRSSGGVVNFTIVDLGSPYNVPTIPITGILHPASFPISHIWVWGAGVTYKSLEFPGLYSATLMAGASAHVPSDSMITGLSTAPDGTFTVVDSTIGANSSVFTVNKLYDYMALSASASFLALHLFASVTGIGAGAPPTVSPSFGFAPGLVFSRQGGLVTNTGFGLWRGPTHLGTDSTRCGALAGNDSLASGITAINGTTINLGSEGAQAGDAYYSWAFASGSAAILPPPVFVLANPFVAPPQGGLFAAGISAGGGQGCRIGTAITPSV